MCVFTAGLYILRAAHESRETRFTALSRAPLSLQESPVYTRYILYSTVDTWPSRHPPHTRVWLLVGQTRVCAASSRGVRLPVVRLFCPLVKNFAVKVVVESE